MANPKTGGKPSKKKMKRIVKAQKRMTPKAKNKAKKAKQIDRANKSKASKRQAAEIVSAKSGKPAISGDMRSEVDAVDKLFASIGESEEEEENAPLEDGSDESSAGAFHDVGEGLGADLEEDEDLEAAGSDDEGGDAGARHEEELKVIKEKDPEFYKFLVQSDKALLDFQAPTEGDDDEGVPGDDEAPEAGEAPGKSEARKKASAAAVQNARKILTPERLKRIQDSVLDSFTACKAALNIYHTAVRSIEGHQTESSDAAWKAAEEERKAKELKAAQEAGEKAKRPKPKKAKKGSSNKLEIDDENIFSEVIEWSVKNLLGAFRHHAGKLRKATPIEVRSRKKGKKQKQKQKKEEDEEFAEEQPEVGTAIDVRRFHRWNRVKTIVKIFFDVTFFLLDRLVGAPMIEYVLRNISGPEAISWMWPFTRVRGLFIRKCVNIWSIQARSQPVRLLSFLFLRNVGAMALQSKAETTRKDDKTPLLDEVMRMMIKGFAQAATAGFTWRTCNSFKVMENCFVEMLRLDDATAYRLGYVCIRQLARILRNATIAVNITDQSKAKGQAKSMARGRNKKVLSDKQKKKRNHFVQATQGLIGWPFIRAVYLWTKAVGSLPSLRDLAYPLSMLIMGAVKSQINKIQMAPFTYHCLFCQNKLGSALGAYVPISSHIIKSFEVLNIAIDKAWHKRKASGYQKRDGQAQGLGGAKAAEIEVLTHLGETQRYDSLTLETVGSNLCFLLNDHMGLLSQSPAFPELVSIVLIHARKLRKHCGSEGLRRQLTNFIQAAEETSEQVRMKREALTEAPPFKKLLLFDADTTLSKARVTLTKRKADEERQSIEAATQEKEKPEADETGGTKKKRSGRRQHEVEEAAEAAAAAEAEATSAKKKRRKAGKKEDRESQKEDKVEEMSFSSDDDKD